MGYNGSVFAYGQTGSGKTFTIQGGDSSDSKGILPRCFEYLFTEIGQIKNKHMLAKRNSNGGPPRSTGNSAGKHHLYNQAMFSDERVDEIEFEVKCQYVEIYNETIYDLLDSDTCGSAKL